MVIQNFDVLNLRGCFKSGGGYRGENFMRWVINMFRWVVEIVLKPTGIEGFCLFTQTLGCRKN